MAASRKRPGRLRNADLWLRRLNAGSRVLPDFLIAGTQKGGTSSLYAYLAEHPSVLPARKKEVHFFDRHWVKGERWYRASFPTGSDMERVRDEHGAAATGESSPSYLFHPLVPERVAATLPDIRVVLLLREPVDRAYSHWRMEHRRGVDRLPFDEAVMAEEERLAGELDRVRADPSYFSRKLRRFSYLSRGHYAEQLERWFEHLPRDRFLIRSAETFFADPAAVHADVLRFLQLPHRELTHAPVVNRGAAGPPLDPELRDRLRDRFAEPNERLFELLGTRFDW